MLDVIVGRCEEASERITTAQVRLKVPVEEYTDVSQLTRYNAFGSLEGRT